MPQAVIRLALTDNLTLSDSIETLTEIRCLFFLDCKNLVRFRLQVVLEQLFGLNPLGILCFELEDPLGAQLLREVFDRGFFGGSDESTVHV